MPLPSIPAAWRACLPSHVPSASLARFVDDERARGAVFPAHDVVFRALALTSPERARVVLLGQDPYHGPGQADGLCFSVPRGTPAPPSLKNLLAELRDDLGVARADGDLSRWAEGGILMLNTVLTVRSGEAGSHRGQGWEDFTDEVVRAVQRTGPPKVFLLLGVAAQAKAKLIDARTHPLVLAAHPSPLSARRGFLGSRPFSRVDDALRALGHPPIDWALPCRAPRGAPD